MKMVKYIPHYTYEDYKSWQGDWELIEGIPVALASPKFIHQKVVLNLASLIKEQLEKCDKCVVTVELDYIVSHDTVFRPDVAVLCSPVEDYIRVAPLMVAEVVSETTAERDEGVKKDIYEQEGVKYYMLLYPEQRLAKVYRNTDRGFIKLKDISEGTLKLNFEECEVEIDFSKVWS